MNVVRRDRIVGLILLIIAVIWSVIVYRTIPMGYGEHGFGPRFFPLLLGIALAGLSTLMLIGSLFGTEDEEAESAREEQQPPAGAIGIALAAGTFILIVLYGFLLEKTGFLLATPVIIAATLIGALGVRRPLVILAMALGITAGCWLVFGEFLGVYLPRGNWISSI